MDRESQNNYDRAAVIYILRRWRWILLAGIILGIFLGGGKLAAGVMTWGDKMTVFEQDLEIYHEEYTLYEEQLELLTREKENSQERFEEYQAYMENSILMNMDAEKKMQAAADILITLDSSEWSEKYSQVSYDPTDSLITLYANSIAKETNWESVSAVSGIELEYVSELVSTTEELDSNILRIVVSHPDEAVASAILDEIISELVLQYDSLVSAVGNHRVLVTSRTTGTVNDQEVFDYQKKMQSAFIEYSQAVCDCQEQLDTLAAPSWPTSEPSRRQICFSALGLGTAGLLIGVLFAICLIYITFVYSGKLHSSTEVEEVLGLRCLGSFSYADKKQKKKRAFSCIDNWIDTLAGNRNEVSPEMMQQLLTFNIQNHIRGAKRVYVTGSVDKLILSEVWNFLTSVFTDIEISVGKNIDKDMVVFQDVMSSEAIILVEKNECSKIMDIVQEVQFVKKFDKDIIGYILIKE